MIEELKWNEYRDINGYYVTSSPTIDQIIDKVNEIIRELNKRGDIE